MRKHVWNSYSDAIDECSNPDCTSYEPLEVHHIIPIHEGGSDEFNNVIVLCRHCHMKRTNRLHTDWMINYDKLHKWKTYVDAALPLRWFDDHIRMIGEEP